MSELKAFVARKIDDGTCDPVPCVEVYLKSEADKVIAELEKENESLKYSVASLETDLAMSRRWRKCSDELPKDGETVLVLLGRTPKTRGFFLTSRYVAGVWTYGEDPQGCKPTHWFRIPKAPEVK